LIRDKEYDSYLQNIPGCVATYSSDIGTAIFDELPKHISEKETSEREVIRSDNPRFNEILIKELFGSSNMNGLMGQIKNLEDELRRKKKNERLILDALPVLGGIW